MTPQEERASNKAKLDAKDCTQPKIPLTKFLTRFLCRNRQTSNGVGDMEMYVNHVIYAIDILEAVKLSVNLQEYLMELDHDLHLTFAGITRYGFTANEFLL